MRGRAARCSVCGKEPADPVPDAGFLLTDAVRGRRGPPYRLCATCRRSNEVRRRRLAAEQESLGAQRAAAVTRLVPDAATWLQGAPVVEALPEGEIGRHDELFPRHPFVEVMDLPAAARYVAAVKLGHLPGRRLVFRFFHTTPEPPFPRYDEAIVSSDHRYAVPSHLYAAVYRLPAGDVAFHWRRTGDPPPP
jgi:hypothetical protein